MKVLKIFLFIALGLIYGPIMLYAYLTYDPEGKWGWASWRQSQGLKRVLYYPILVLNIPVFLIAFTQTYWASLVD